MGREESEDKPWRGGMNWDIPPTSTANTKVLVRRSQPARSDADSVPMRLTPLREGEYNQYYGWRTVARA